MISPTSTAGVSQAQKGADENISSVFDVKTWEMDNQARFSDLKKAIWKDSMIQSWAQVLTALKEAAEQIESLGSKVGSTTENPPARAQAAATQAIPRVHYDELRKGLSQRQTSDIKEAGVVIVRGAVPKEVCH
jgi:hypothetical protein